MGAPYVEDALAFDTVEEQRNLDFVGKINGDTNQTVGGNSTKWLVVCKGSLLNMPLVQV